MHVTRHGHAIRMEIAFDAGGQGAGRSLNKYYPHEGVVTVRDG
ncbi:hypothetical protein ABC383_26145 [Noviherbaspirillum sp. 1P10PC]